MAIRDLPSVVKRVTVRETAGRVLRWKEARADNTEAIADLVLMRGNPNHLQPEDFKRAADRLHIDNPAILHAVADAESALGGFDPDCPGRVIIAVECHAFSEATAHAWDVKRPDCSYPEWIPWERGVAPPKGMTAHPYTLSQDDRWQLFMRQAELSLEGALCALSVGRFQPLVGVTPAGRRQGRKPGWMELGFASAEAMVRYLGSSEFAQLEVLHGYLVAHNLVRAFRERDWQTIARGYNGPANVKVYADRMADAFKKRTRLYA